MTDSSDPLKDWLFGSWTDRIWHRCPGEVNNAHTITENGIVTCVRCGAKLDEHLAFIAQIAEPTDEWKNLQEFVAIDRRHKLSDIPSIKVKKR